MSPVNPFPLGRDSVVVLCKGGRLPGWHDVERNVRDGYRQEHVDLMLSVARNHGLLGIEGYRMITAQGPWQWFWVMELPNLEAAEAWIEAEMRPPSGAYGFYEYHLARRHAVDELSDWASQPPPAVDPASDPHRVPDLAARTDSIVILLFGRWLPEAELADPAQRGDAEHVELMKSTAREHGLMRIESYQLIAPMSEWHRAWVIEFPDLPAAEAWFDAEVLPPHGRYSSKQYHLARPWAPDYFAAWASPLPR